MGTGIGPEPVRTLERIGLAVHGERAPELRHSGKRSVDAEESVCAFGSRSCGRVEISHPGGQGILGLDRRNATLLLCGTDGEVLRVLEERQPGGSYAVICAEIVVSPSQILGYGVGEKAVIAHHIAVNGADSGLEQELFPASEKALDGLGAGDVGPKAGVRPTHNVEVAVQDTVAHGAAVGKSGLETEIGPQFKQGKTRREQLHVRGGDQLLTRVHAGEGIAILSQGKNRYDAAGQRLAGADAVNRRTCRRGLFAPGSLRSRNRALAGKQERDAYRKKNSCGHLFH